MFAFRIWDAQFEILRFEIRKTDRSLCPEDGALVLAFHRPSGGDRAAASADLLQAYWLRHNRVAQSLLFCRHSAFFNRRLVTTFYLCSIAAEQEHVRKSSNCRLKHPMLRLSQHVTTYQTYLYDLTWVIIYTHRLPKGVGTHGVFTRGPQVPYILPYVALSAHMLS